MIVSLLILPALIGTAAAAIIIDQNAVDDFNKIPDYYIEKVKGMRFQYFGASHGSQMENGLKLLYESNNKYKYQFVEYPANIVESGGLIEYDGYYNAGWGALHFKCFKRATLGATFVI